MPRGGQAPKDFCTHALLHIPDGQPQSRNKTLTTRKKSEGKLDFLRGNSGSEDRRQEHVSQLALSRLQLDFGSWRSVTATLNLEGETATLTVHGEDGSVLHNVPIHTLKHTSIRHAHRSLFFRPYVLALYPPSSSQQSPLCLDMPNRETLHGWLALLRAYAQAEVYGRTLATSASAGSSSANALANDGGLYRLWRQFDVVVLDGRLHTDVVGSPSKASDSDADLLFVELYVDGLQLARTTAQRSYQSNPGPEWHESLAIPDMPPAQRAIIRLSRIRRGMSFALGEVQLELGALPRGAWQECRCAVQPLDDSRSGASPVAELRLRLRIDEEIVLPQPAYAGLLETLSSRNFLEWQRDLDIRLGPAAAALRPQLIAVVSARKLLIEHMIDGASREVEAVPLSANPNTLFRSNTVFTKAMETVLARSGASFLESAIGPIIRRICAERLVIETDPTRGGQLRQIDVKEVDRNAALLARWTTDVWDSIYSARSEVPQELRRLLQHLRLLVENRSPATVTQENAWQGVSAFFFLRFVVPAILRPHSFGLIPGLPDPVVSRTLTLIGKVIQGLANLNTTVDRAEYMRPVKDFLTGHVQSMVDFLIEVSTALPAPSSFAPVASSDSSGIAAALKARQSTLPVLYRDAVPRLPDLTDLSRHVALISSAVVRHAASDNAANALPTPRGSAEGSPPRSMAKPTPLLDGLVSKCQEVEGRARRRVSRFATHGLPTPRERSRSNARRPATSNGTPSRPGSAGVGATRDIDTPTKISEVLRAPLTPISDTNTPLSPISKTPIAPPLPDPAARTRKVSTPFMRRSNRPSTAPTPSHPPLPSTPQTTPPRGILVNNNTATNRPTPPLPHPAPPPMPPLLLPILSKPELPPKSPQKSNPQPVSFTSPFSPQLDINNNNNSYSPSIEKGGWSRTSAPTLVIPDGLSRKPFTTLQGIASTDSLHVRTRSLDPGCSPTSNGGGLFRIISRDQSASPAEPRKKRRNLLKVLIGMS